MRNRSKKEQSEMDRLIGFFILVAGLVGWYKTGSLKGVLIAVGIGFGIVLFFGVWRVSVFKKRMQQSGVSDIDQMTGRQFEEFVGTLFASQGYSVKYTPVTGDYGADVILKKGQEVIVVQAKRYKKSVGVKAVQEVIPAINIYNATAAWVITNSTFTKQALTLATSNQVRMIDRKELVRMSIEMKERVVRSVEKTG